MSRVVESPSNVELTCPDERSTAQLGEDVALALRPGELVTLSGELGAGKTFFARTLIRAAADDALLEVPSPTFTLAQAYEGLPFGRLTHMDLYRLTDPSELDELGLEDALAEGVVLMEWPEKGDVQSNQVDLAIAFETLDGDARTVTIKGESAALDRVCRSLSIRHFLDEQGHSGVQRVHLTGDASTRAYETIREAGGDAIILMNAPEQPDGPPIRDGKPYSQIARLAESMDAYVAIDQTLRKSGFCVPEIFAADMEQGLFLIENLGSGTIITAERNPIPDRYRASIEVLAQLHSQTWESSVRLPSGSIYAIPTYDREALAIEVDLLPEWYAEHSSGRPLGQSDREAYDAIWQRLFDKLQGAEQTLVLRDFHSPNIIWRDDKRGPNRVGIIDFQDAVIGPTAYDVGALVWDARVDVPEALSHELVDHYCTVRSVQGAFDEEAFRETLAIMAAQRIAKILGIFVRLSKRDGKHGYLAHLPRMEAYFEQSCSHPALAELRQWADTVLTK